ncbi:MAG: hypothetical protein P4M11_12420 [Candidatus Pacebacteria bacterium]|nr:hypothetical protein [Candidatus Paceibacterota bacterium]
MLPFVSAPLLINSSRNFSYDTLSRLIFLCEILSFGLPLGPDPVERVLDLALDRGCGLIL